MIGGTGRCQPLKESVQPALNADVSLLSTALKLHERRAGRGGDCVPVRSVNENGGDMAEGRDRSHALSCIGGTGRHRRCQPLGENVLHALEDAASLLCTALKLQESRAGRGGDCVSLG